MIYGSSNAQSALGSLLRKMQEESQTNPAKTPVSAEGSSPIRQQIQGPIDSPEAIGSEKVVAMKPEMAISQETPSPVAPTSMPIDAANSPVGPVASQAPAVNPVVAPTNVIPQSSPTASSGITSPVKSFSSTNNNSTPNNSNSSGNNNNLATNSFLPSSIKSISVGSKSTPPSASPTPTPIQQNNSQTSSQSGASLAINQLLPSLSKLIQRSILGIGTIMSQSTLNKAIQSMMYGGKKVSKT